MRFSHFIVAVKVQQSMSHVSQNIHRLSAASLGWLKGPIAPSAELKLLRSLERVLWASSAILLSFCAFAYARAAMHQSHQLAQLNSARARFAAGPGAGSAKTAPPYSFIWNTAAADQLWEETAPLGILEIPRLQISAVAEEGVNDHTLDLSVGHVPKSAYPGQSGNAAFAAHRDTYFKNLESVQTGDKIVFKSLQRDYHYQVSSIQIVDANATSVLNDTPQSTITLVTCYPFHYIGSAPKRFVVTARQTAP